MRGSVEKEENVEREEKVERDSDKEIGEGQEYPD
jgi:hypothetical protein